MSLREEIEQWGSALKAYDDQDFDLALDHFAPIASTSKIMFNMGLIYATRGEHQQAVDFFTEANGMDEFLAVSFFQRGVSNFLIGRMEEAERDFDMAHQTLRNNDAIDYEQLGLSFKLFSCEVLFNRALSLAHLGDLSAARTTLAIARTLRLTPAHDVIDSLPITDFASYTVFSIPVGVVFRPSEKKLKNIQRKDFLGKARVIAATSESDNFEGFTGVTRERERWAALERSNSSAKMLAGGGMQGEGEERPGLKRAKTTLALGRTRGNENAGSGVGMGMGSDLRRRPTQAPTAPPVAPPPAQPFLQRSQTIDVFDTSLAHRRSVSESASAALGVGLTNMMGDLRPGLRISPAEANEGVDERPSKTAPAPTVGGLLATPLRPNRPNTDIISGFLDQYRGGPADYLESLETGGDDDAGRRACAPPTPPPEPQQPQRSQELEQPQLFQERRPQPQLQQPQPQPQPHVQPQPQPQPQRSHPQPQPQPQQQSRLRPASPPRPLQQQQQQARERLDSPERARGREPVQAKTVVSSKGVEPASPSRGMMRKIRVKLHFEGDVRGMSIPHDTDQHSFVNMVLNKFSLRDQSRFSIKYRDEDDVLVSIVDEGDWESAIDEARDEHSASGAAAAGREMGKMEVWVESR